MTTQSLMDDILRENGERGIFNKHDWIKEADGKLVCAKLLRDIALNKLSEFKKLKQEKGELISSKDVSEMLSIREPANKSSVLMLGYAIELLLKSGIVSLLINAPKKLLDKRVKAYSHDLLSIALDLHMELSDDECSMLSILGSYIILEARYPVTASSIKDYCEKINSIREFLSCEKQFLLGVSFFNKLRTYIKIIDGTEDNIKLLSKIKMGKNGYFTFRVGGNFPPVFIIKFCQSQIDQKMDKLETVKSLLLEKNKVNKTIFSYQMEESWETAIFYRVDGKKENSLLKLIN